MRFELHLFYWWLSGCRNAIIRTAFCHVFFVLKWILRNPNSINTNSTQSNCQQIDRMKCDFYWQQITFAKFQRKICIDEKKVCNGVASNICVELNGQHHTIYYIDSRFFSLSLSLWHTAELSTHHLISIRHFLHWAWVGITCDTTVYSMRARTHSHSYLGLIY